MLSRHAVLLLDDRRYLVGLVTLAGGCCRPCHHAEQAPPGNLAYLEEVWQVHTKTLQDFVPQC